MAHSCITEVHLPKRSELPAKPPLALKQSHDSARSKIAERIRKGQELKAAKVESHEQAEAFDAEYRKWNDYNETLLTTLFTTDEPMMKYRWSVSGGIILGGESVYDQYHRRIDQITTLCNALESLSEKLDLILLAPSVSEGPGSSEVSTKDAVWSLIHEEVRAVARTRFDDGHYADAVEAALKALNNEVKSIATSRGAADMDGATLMHTVFSPKNPLIVVADLSTQTGKDMQQGYMELFAGAISAVRNPKAHDNVVIDAERALHFLFLASTLWHTLDARL